MKEDLDCNKTKNLFYKIALICYLCGLPNFWIEDFRLPKWFMKYFDTFTRIINVAIYFFVAIEVAAFFTQDNLTEKQKSDLMLYGISHPLLYAYRVMMSKHQHTLRKLMLNMVVNLKKVYSDLEVERQMISKSTWYSRAFISSCILAMLLYTFDAWSISIRTGATFNAVITAWPNTEDRSTLASIFRLVFYLFWWILMSRVFAAFILVICLITCLSHQFQNLQCYFRNLNNIFEQNVSQKEKEQRYEEGFKVGIGLHFDTLQCTKDSQLICRGVFSGQIVFNVILLVLFMLNMANSERTLVSVFAILFAASAVLTGTGFFMLNAGNVTVEASHLATAIYFSGWHNCQSRSSVRIRKLVVVTMSNAQKPVVLKGLGIVELSYQSFVSIVKSSYSVFSVLY